MLEEYLGTMGYRDISTAYSAEDALQMVDDQDVPFDCFLLDIKMTGMDGIELCRALRERRDCRTAPIIMITSSEAKEHMPAAFEAGATDYLKKPLDVVELEARMRMAMLLVESTARESASREALQSLLQDAPEDEDRFDPGEVPSFSDVEGLFDYYYLENKLLKMGEGIYAMSLVSVQIRGFDDLCHQARRKEMLALVRAAAAVITESIPKRGLITSYIGHGRFVCVTIVRNRIVPRLLQARLHDRFKLHHHEGGQTAAGQVTLDVRAISDRRVLTAPDALSLLKKEIKAAHADQGGKLPPVNEEANRIFDRMEAPTKGREQAGS